MPDTLTTTRRGRREPVTSTRKRTSERRAGSARSSAVPKVSLNLTENSLAVLRRRYLKKKDGKPIEEPIDMFWRVARNIASADRAYGATEAGVAATELEFLKVMTSGDFLPNSPTLMNAGRDLQQLSACFVLPVPDSIEGIFDAVKYQAIIHQSGGGTGFSFSRLRPSGSLVKSTHGVASGPVTFMRVFNAATDVVKQGGTRRGANMAILRVDHPDVLTFIKLKEDMNEMRNFNISVAVTEKFMDALRKGEKYDLVAPHNGEVTGQLDAREVFNLLVHHAWLTGDPGVVFIDRANKLNPARHVETLEATNPCGEQWLAPNDSCNLGSINVGRYVKAGTVDWDRLRKTVHSTVHFLDNIIDMNRYPIPQITEKTMSNRRIGLGVMGFADLLIELGVPYNSPEGIDTGRTLMRFVHEEAKNASEDLAKVRGNFPNYPGSDYERIGRPMRNVAVDTVAPTGTISMIADCSSGIEPLFAIAFTKTVMDGTALAYVHPKFESIAKKEGWYSKDLMDRIAWEGSIQSFDEVPDKWKRVFVTAADCAPEDHVRMQAAFQEFVDNAISKTVNFPHEATEEEVSRVYMLAYELGCKGVTVFRDGSRDEQVLTTGKTKLVGQEKSLGEDPNASAQSITAVKTDTALKTEEPAVTTALANTTPRERPSVMKGTTYKVPTPYGNLYITINDDERGLPFEVFAAIGKTGGFFAAQSEAICRLISLGLRSGIDPDAIIDQLKGIRGPDISWHAGGQLLSLPDAIAKILDQHRKRDQSQIQFSTSTAPTANPAAGSAKSTRKTSVANTGYAPACPDCGSMLEFSEGCMKCRSCGFSKCG
jgi:ribonucleoside-diphosphate reductase alpha chain